MEHLPYAGKFQQVSKGKTIQNIFFDQSGIEVVINNIKVTRKPSHIWKSSSLFLNKQ